MHTALKESINKWIEYHANIYKQRRAIPRTTRLVFDQYDKSEVYPKLVIEVKDIDVLDKIWRSQATVVVQLWVANEETPKLNQLSSFMYELLRYQGEFIPIYDHYTVLYDENDLDVIKDLELGEKITIINNGVTQLTHPTVEERSRIPTPFSNIVEESVVIYESDTITRQVGNEYQLNVDFTIDYTTGVINWITPVDLAVLETLGKELRCYYTYRVFKRFSKVLEGSVLETPFNMPQENFPGMLRTDFTFDVLY